jgi:large subunit ribosomal protein L10
MSKVIKQMEMSALKDAFKDVRNLVLLSIKGLNAQAEHTLRANLRKKKLRLQMIKNSLTRRVFDELGMVIDGNSPFWQGPTTLVWGPGGVAETSRDIDAELKQPKLAPVYKDKVAVKGAIVEGQPISFEEALKMPTRLEAIGQILSAILGPAAAIAGALTGPASQVASQIEQIEKKGGESGEAAPAEAAPAAG